MIFLNDWFQIGPIPAQHLVGQYDGSLVLLSYVVAVLASYVTLTLVARIRELPNDRTSFYWLLGGAFTMGAGIWSMHFIGMLAFVLPMPMEYEGIWTLASLLMAMFASGIALFILQKKYSHSIFGLAVAGFLMGLAISCMHYMGMQAMKSHINIHYLPFLFILSILIGIAAAEIALWLALESNKGSQQRQSKLKIGSALIMGLAICGMHYTGMAASIFTILPNHIHHETAIPENFLASTIAIIMAFIFTLALVASSYYKRMRDAVQNEKDFLNAMLNNLEDGILACNEKGNITVLNDAIKKYFPTGTFDKILNIEDLPHVYQLYSSDNRLVEKESYPVSRIFRGEVLQKMPFIIKRDGHPSIDLMVNGQPITNSEGKFLGAVLVAHDVTELKRTERIKNEFIAVVSHELKTPLVSIQGGLILLIHQFLDSLPEKAKLIVAMANKNCERLVYLINDILDFEKIEAGKMDFQLQNIDLNQLVHNTVNINKIYAKKYSVSLKIDQKDIQLTVYVDPNRLMQVLTNLISNACKFSPPKSIVRIRIERFDNKVRVSVIDKGPGIPLEFQENIFHKFPKIDIPGNRVKTETGLGLHISKTMITKMGGDLGFVSSDEGSIFYFDFACNPNIRALA